MSSRPTLPPEDPYSEENELRRAKEHREQLRSGKPSAIQEAIALLAAKEDKAPLVK